MKIYSIINLALAILMTTNFIIGCAEEKTPSRDQIPVIKERISRLQKGIQEKNMAVIDSLMSVEILKKNQTSESLLAVVFGANDEIGFKSFGTPEIIYTDDFASIAVPLNDSTPQSVRTITFTFEYDAGQWLLIDFKSGQPDYSP